MHELFNENINRVTRRQLFGSARQGIGLAALASLLHRDSDCKGSMPGLVDFPHHAPRAKRMVMLWQGGGPSHVDLFDPKDALFKRSGEDIPESIRGTTRLSTMSSGYSKWPVVAPIKKFQRFGQCAMVC